MNTLIVHQNFPGQFPHVVDALLARGDKVAAIGGETAKGRPGVDLRRWKAARGSTKGLYPPATRAEADLIRAEAAAHAAAALKRDGFVPDVIVGHPGWGETLHLKTIWPAARMVLFAEYFYGSAESDTGFDPEFGLPDLAATFRINGKNATQALAYVQADRLIAPTAYQRSTFPPLLRDRIAVAHEGVDLGAARRREGARLKLPGGRVLTAERPVITYVSRTLEPMRGFHIFLRALPALLAAVPEAEVVVIGEAERAGYGAPPPAGARSWAAHFVGELGPRLDGARVHLLGRVPHDVMVDAFSISAAHVYYTYPFTLSWSLVEAMACECRVIASDTAPVRDAIADGVEGRLLPFFDVDALSAALIAAARDPAGDRAMRARARETALARFDRAAGTAAWLAAIDAVAGG